MQHPSILAKCLCPIPPLESGTPPPQGDLLLCQSCGPLEGPWTVSDRLRSGNDLKKEGGHNLDWGALCEGRLAFGSWSSLEWPLHINCIKIMAVFITLKALFPALKEHALI
ncbi:Alanine--tRNA ligase [Labeo rohita]|uniref:Alanine--tRNA ligase n=1 Tax=Labeo rohita TaxID=84645 RepID=A0ABQ8MV44_LABRO|nr:Alanine--tRNA ligase [Labeo rohita]